MEIDHIGVATDDADGLAARYETLFDLPVVHEETSEEKGLRFSFLDCGNGYFELIEPVDRDSTIGRYLDDNGGGIHHVALVTEDVHAAIETARSAGADLIDETPRPGAWGHEIAFLHPASTGGALIEYVEHR